MTRERQSQFVTGYAGTIVADHNAPDAATVEPNFNAGRAGIDGVLQQLFQDGRGPLDNLAGGDLANERVGKRGN